LETLKTINQMNPTAYVLAIGRNNNDLKSILGKTIAQKRSFDDTKKIILISDQFPNLKIEFITAHSSKGLEADYVIIINADDKELGFPNKVEDDHLLSLVLSSKSNFEFSEERRLWYVALTRTKNHLFILVDINNPSVFVNEIEEKCKVMNPEFLTEYNKNINCPYCKSGHLVGRNNNKFMGCSNYPYCEYKLYDLRAIHEKIICQLCGDFLVLRKGKYGPFMGCNSYPKCSHSQNLN
jgi:DNA helicase-4